MSKLLTFLKLCYSKNLKLICGLVLQLLLAVSSFAVPEVSRQGANAIQNGDANGLKLAAILAIVSTIIYIPLSAIVKINKKQLENIYVEGIQIILFKKLLSFKKKALQDMKKGEAITNIINNAAEAATFSLSSVWNYCNGFFVLSISVIYMGYVEWRIMLAIVIYNVIIRFLMSLTEKHLELAFVKLNNIRKNNNSFIIDILNNMLTIRVFQKFSFFNQKLFEKETETLKARMKGAALGNGFRELIWVTMKWSEYFILYGYGGYMVYKGQTKIGTLFAFNFIIDIFVKGINSFSDGIIDKNTALGTIKYVEEMMEIAETENEKEFKISNDGYAIQFENVSFGYFGNLILENVSFVIKENEKIVIKGSNGSGKSTLLNLIAGLCRPNSGKIFYGGSDVSNVNIDCLSNNYAYISQNSNILSGNVPENIAFSTEYDDKRCDSVLDMLNLNGKKESLPKTLSMGEKQRINIGRAIYRVNNVNIIFGDEIFANVDKDNVNNIASMLKEEFSNKTVIFVCHDDLDFGFEREFVVKDKGVTVFERGVAL